MPFYYPYGQGNTDLERFNPNPRTDFSLKELADTLAMARQAKIGKMSQARDREMLNQILTRGGISPEISSGGILPQEAPMQAPPGAMTETGAAQPGLLSKIMSGAKEMFTGGRVTPDQLPISDLEKAMAEAAIKGQYGEYKPRTFDEAIALEQAKAGLKPWKPQTKEEQLGFEAEKEKVKTEAQAERKKEKMKQDIDFAVNSVENLMVPMIKAFRSMRDRTGGAGRIAGVANVLGGATGFNPEVKPFEGQKLEVASALARIAMPGIRSQRAIDLFKKTLPNEFSTDEEAERQIRNSVHNAVARGYAARGLPYTGKEQADTEKIIQRILSESGYGSVSTPSTSFKNLWE